jgi:aminopeptidase N
MLKILLFYFAVAVLSVAHAQRLKLYEQSKFRNDFKSSSFLNEGRQQKLVETDTYRLPNNSHPDIYELDLVIKDFDKNELEFDGDLKLVVEMLEDSQNITLHSHQSLRIENVILYVWVNGVEVAIPNVLSYDRDRDFLIIETSQTLVKGTFPRLEIKYKGQILDGRRAGIYRGSYLTQDASQR